MTDLLKTEENTFSEVKHPERKRSSQIQGSSHWDLLAPAWQVCQAQTESRWNWNQSHLPLTVTFTAFQLSHQSVRHNTSPLPRDLGGLVFLCHDHCVRLL